MKKAIILCSVFCILMKENKRLNIKNQNCGKPARRLDFDIFALCILIFTFSHAARAANEIRSFTGCVDAFAVVREIDGDIWYVSGQAFEAFGTSGHTMLDYDIALTAEGGDMFSGTFDTNIGAGYYYVVTHDDVDSTPADADPGVWQDYGYWTGTVWTSGPDAAAIASLPADTADAVWDELSTGHVDAGKAGQQQWTDVDAILTDTHELQTDWTDGGRLDLLIDAIKYKTDLITIHDDTIKTANDANNFILNAGKDANDAFNYHIIMVTDADDSNTELRWIDFWYDDGGTDPNVTVDRPFSFTPAAGDVVHIMGTGYGGWLRYIMNKTDGKTDIFDFRVGNGAARLNAEDDDP